MVQNRRLKFTNRTGGGIFTLCESALLETTRGDTG